MKIKVEVEITDVVILEALKNRVRMDEINDHIMGQVELKVGKSLLNALVKAFKKQSIPVPDDIVEQISQKW